MLSYVAAPVSVVYSHWRLLVSEEEEEDKKEETWEWNEVKFEEFEKNETLLLQKSKKRKEQILRRIMQHSSSFLSKHSLVHIIIIRRD